jgi:hypothetical protein
VAGCRRLIRMPATRFVLTLTAAAALLAGVSSAGAAGPLAPPRPTGLKAFLLKTDEPATHVFPRTPSFAWNPVKGALRYEFQLATTMRFNEDSVVWSNVDPKTQTAPGVEETEDAETPATTQTLPATLRQLRSPALALDVALPWITGEPYSLHARVRAVLRGGATRWSNPFGFNVRWPGVPRPLDAAPGLIRWTPVDGATAYQVMIAGASWRFTTTTNVADLRSLYTFHQRPEWTRNVFWRVRAVREVYGKVANGLPVASQGPWSPIYGSTNPDFVFGGPLTLSMTLSDSRMTEAGGTMHRLMPAFTWTGTIGTASGLSFNPSPELWRVYVATDRDCVNIVHRGAVVGSPAYAPRGTGGLKMPHDDKSLADARNKAMDVGLEGEALMLDGDTVTPSEQATPTGMGSVDSGNVELTLSKTDLWDNAWKGGGYYWTVVPVVMEQKETVSGGASTGFRYRDLELPQDACRSGRVMQFGKTSDRVITAKDAPYASGMSTRGLLSSATRKSPTFYGTPLVAWEPALGAEQYELQWSKSGYPFKPTGTTTTAATSALLPLTPGRWYYRVRGLNRDAVTKPEMAWSVPVRLEIAKPVFAIARSGR